MANVLIAIKNFEMPSYCLWDCPLAREDGGACQLVDIKTSDKEKPKDCPLVEIEERKVGKWVKYNTTDKYDYLGDRVTVSNYKCSECGRMIYDIGDSPLTNKLKDYPFCHCGAEMRGAENE